MPAAPLPTDEAHLWSRLKTGDQAALGELYDRHARTLHRYGRRIVYDDPTIWDAVHDVFVDVWKYRQTLTVEGDGRFYLFRALRNRLVRQVTEAARWADEPLDPPDALRLEADWGEEPADAETSRNLQRALQELSPRQREIIQLRFFDDRSYDEIAGMLGINKQSVHNLVFRALESLRSRLLLVVSAGLLTATLHLLWLMVTLG
mgnify:FL=1